MKRREFFKVVAGAIGGFFLGPKVEEYVAPIVGEDDERCQVITAYFKPKPSVLVFMSAVNGRGERSDWVRAEGALGAARLVFRPSFTEIGEQVRVDLRSVDFGDPNKPLFTSVKPIPNPATLVLWQHSEPRRST